MNSDLADDRAGLRGEPSPTTRAQLDRCDPPCLGHASDEPGKTLERIAAGGEWADGREAPVNGLDKGPAAQDPFIR